MKKLLAVVGALTLWTAQAQYLNDLGPEKSTNDLLKVTGAYLSVNRQTGEMSASGGVSAVSAPYRFLSDHVSRDAHGRYDFGEDCILTTCTNDIDHLHWKLTGTFEYREQRSIRVKNAWVYLHDLPVLWVPYWYYPMNSDYGFRLTPGYRSRWGLFFLSGYVYNIINEHNPDAYSLGGSTYADFRTKNGFALGQTIRWNLKDFGRGKIKAYYAWDEDYDRYTRHWDDYRYNYRNWGSSVDRERYRIVLDHAADLTERDAFRVHATYLSDSHFLYDFFERAMRGESIPANEMWYEHRENDWAAGASVSGPVNDFYGGTARLPEGFLDISPQPVWTLPVNYESQTRAGYLNRQFAKYASDEPMFRYAPYIGADGRGADYQAFRADTAHRLTVPFKLWDTLSVVPRAGYRGTYWSDSGDAASSYLSASGDALYRGIAEIGFTASARATGWLNDDWRHTFEPYFDYSYQNVNISSGSGKRYYTFDNYDRSTDWLDQFGFEGRGLPYNWHGVRPGIRNVFQRRDDKGILRTFLDTDIYAAVPFETVSYHESGALRGYPKDPEDGNYNRNGRHEVVPGTRIRLNPTRDISFLARAEYDCQNRNVGYADIMFKHRITKNFSYYIDYIGRDQKVWDYLPSEYDRWNEELSNILSVGIEHTVCDWLAWSPFIRHDCRRDEVEEYGAWIDFLTDCLGYRISVSHQSSFTRVDGSKYDSDNRIVFYVYLRAFGASSMLDLVRF